MVLVIRPGSAMDTESMAARSRRLRRLNRAALTALGLLLVIGVVARWEWLQVETGWFLAARTGAPLQVIAHRGDVQRFPENTLAAIAAAAASPADGVEFDVQSSRDGTWWVIHDATLDRTTDASGPLIERPDSEIRAATVNGGIGFREGVHRRVHLSTLAEVLDALAGYEGWIYVDAQHASRAADVGELAEALRPFNAVILVGDRAAATRVKAVDGSVQAFGRPARLEGDTDGVDGLLVNAWREAGPGDLGDWTLPVTVFVDTGVEPGFELDLLRRAWSRGYDTFLTRQLDAALELRDELAASDA